MNHELAIARDYLATLHPGAPWLALTVATFAAAYGIRRWLPRVWIRAFSWVPLDAPGLVRDALQAFAVAAPATALAALASGGSVVEALLGLAAGIAAPVAHHVLRAAPVQYQGAIRKAAPLSPRGAVKAGTLAALALMASAVALGIWLATGCTAAQKSTIRTADDGLRAACELLAAEQAEALGLTVEDVIKTTCAAERFSRDLREHLLSAQRRELEAAGLSR